MKSNRSVIYAKSLLGNAVNENCDSLKLKEKIALSTKNMSENTDTVHVAVLDKTKGNVSEKMKLNNHYLICPNPLGRLGNLMFEFASSVGIAKVLNYIHVIKPSHTLVKYFEIKQISERKFENVLTVTEGQWRNMEWRKEQKYLSYNLTMSGYFQSWKIFSQCFR